ncbi:MAG: iron uptake porin [Synechococcales bacterium]|nr:iron uptake porin [Synechococcales bacterium]
MSKPLTCLGISLLILTLPTAAIADDSRLQLPQDSPDLEQVILERVTNVSELTDVQPTDWAFQSLQALVERHGVLQGYPNRTFQGNRALSRYEFAAALRQAIPQMDLSQYATRKDLQQLQRLLDEFKRELEQAEQELATVERRLNQFSTTTKLNGDVIFALTLVSDRDRIGSNSNDRTDSNLAFGNRVSLELSTSLTGTDLLRTTLKTGNIRSLSRATGTEMARLSFQNDERNDLALDELFYRQRLNPNLRFTLIALGGSLNKFAETFNPFAESSGAGVLSRFGQRNPIYRQGGGAGLGLTYDFNKNLSLSLGYLADDADDPEAGLFGGRHAAIVQLTVDLSKTAGFGLTYVRAYNSLDTATGSERANDPFGGDSDAIISNSFGIQSVIGITPKLALSGWVGLTHAYAQDLPNKPTANIVNWTVMLSFPDLGKEGNLGGIVIGQPPNVTQNEFTFRRQAYADRDTTLHVEAFYRHRINDFITITPGLLVLLHPEHDRNNRPLYVGTIRTTFSF